MLSLTIAEQFNASGCPAKMGISDEWITLTVKVGGAESCSKETRKSY